VLLAFAPDSVRDTYLLENPLVGITPRTIVEPSELRLELVRTRLLGFAVDEEEFREGVACVAAPLLERPPLSTRIGVVCLMIRASAPNLRGLPSDSR